MRNALQIACLCVWVVGSRKPVNDGQQVKLVENHFLDHAMFDGLQLPTKIKTLVDGQPFLTVELNEIEFPDKLDPALFEEPK